MSRKKDKDIMKHKGMKYIGEGGSGSKARVRMYSCNRFPGIGGEIITYESSPVAFRRMFFPFPKAGIRIFYRHLIIKKLEDYFFQKGIYSYAHINRPLGTFNQGYLYEWAWGSEGFPWEQTEVGGNKVITQLDNWNEFIGAFLSAGINLRTDCADADDGRISQNIIHQFDNNQENLNHFWKRIDFGLESIKFDLEKVTKYIVDHEKDMRRKLKIGRFDLLYLTIEFLKHHSKISERDLGRLEQLTLNYRISTLSHLKITGVKAASGVQLLPK